MEYFNDSIDVRIPTNAIIPNAMIKIVSTVLKRWLLMEVSDILIFSVISNFTRGTNFYSGKPT
jgi:hypothetical protein